MYIDTIRTNEAAFDLPGMPSAQAAEDIKAYAQDIIDRARSGFDGEGNMLGHLTVALDQHGFALVVHPDYHSMEYPPKDIKFTLAVQPDTAAAKRVAALRGDVPALVRKAVRQGTSPLKAWREHTGLTLRGLAEITGIPHATLQRHEQSVRPRTKTLDAWALGLKVDRALLEKTYAMRG